MIFQPDPTPAGPGPDDESTERVRRRTETTLAFCALFPEAIDARLAELDEELDIDRALERAAAIISLVGVLLGASLRHRRWLALPLAAQAVMLRHAAGGPCAPLALFREMGLRTREEIDRERAALQTLRGDFGVVCVGASASARAGEALRAAATPEGARTRAPGPVKVSPPPPT